MPSETTKAVEAQSLQRSASKRATLEGLRSKKRRGKELELMLDGEAVSFAIKAIGSGEYDKLLTANPPNLEQKAQGMAYNLTNFAPGLLARVIEEPALTADQWADIWKSPDWNRGELMTLFSEAVEICNEGLPLGPTAQG